MRADSNPFDVRVVALDGASITPSPAGQTLTNEEGTWSFGTPVQASGNDILLNGVRTGAGARIFKENGVLYHLNALGARYFRLGTSWVLKV
jgi:hypothetical protein